MHFKTQDNNLVEYKVSKSDIYTYTTVIKNEWLVRRNIISTFVEGYALKSDRLDCICVCAFLTVS